MAVSSFFACLVCLFFFFFFFKQKTAYEMRISDWSSDVCSSDLPPSRDRGPNGIWPMARRVQLQGQPGFSRSLLVPVAGEPVACRGRYIGFGAVVNCRRGCLRFPVAPAKAGAAKIGRAHV